MNLEPLDVRSAPRIAQIHTVALAGDFLPSLGAPFLTQLYRGILELELGFGHVAVDDSGVIGFVLGSVDTERLLRTVMMRWAWSLGWSMLPALWRRPALVKYALQTLTYTQREAAVSARAELVVIAVDAAKRSQGAGTALCEALEADFRRQGIREYKVTVNADNEGANRFYERQGLSLAYSFHLYDRLWNLYTRAVPAAAP